MKFKKLGAMVVAAALTCAVALAGCAGGGNASTSGSASNSSDKASGDYTLVKDGTLTVGVSPDFPPFENLDGEEYVGLDMDLAREVSKEMGLKVEFKTLQFDAILPAVAAGGQVDVGWSGITVDPKRSKTVDFSDPYYVDDQCIVTMKSNTALTKDSYKTDLNKNTVTIAVQSGSTGESYAKEKFPNAKISAFGNATDCFAQLQAGKADAVAINKAVGEKMVASAYTDAQVVAKVATGENYAVAVSKDNPALTKAINKAIKKLEKSGKLDELIQKNLS